MGLVDIPIFDVSPDECKEEWGELCRKVRESCEEHGCFLVTYNRLSLSLCEDTFKGLQSLFHLPEDTKKKHQSSLPFCSYSGKFPGAPLRESFGIENASDVDSATEFTSLLWPHGNPSFRETMRNMSSKMLELNLMVLKMVMEGLGVGKYHDLEKAKTRSVFRLTKYSVPAIQGSGVGLMPHTDKEILTTLCQNDVQGLEILTKDGHWNKVMLPRGSFIVIVGDLLKAWSNGRVHAATHRVMMTGDKDRYSCGLFLVPKEGTVVEVPSELVDEHHPLLYRQFTYGDYITYFMSSMNEDPLEVYAGIRSCSK